jgi:hypothetical protein
MGLSKKPRKVYALIIFPPTSTLPRRHEATNVLH